MACKRAIAVLSLVFLSACSSVPMESPENNIKAKQFSAPSEGNAGLFIYRNSFVGQALKKDVWVDGRCIGMTAPYVFFYEEVPGDKTYKISTESEFSPNDILVSVKKGMLYFIRQYIKVGVFVGGAGLELVNSTQGQEDVSKLDMAVKGHCDG
ncbi:MAG: DUF2846 domain-containing protein [Magnetovibrionaceae bacterium]